MYQGAIVMDSVNTLSTKYIEYLVIPKWSKNRKGELDVKIAQIKETAGKRGIKCVDYQWI